MTAGPSDNSAADGGLVVETDPGLEDIRFLEDGLIDFNIQTTGITDGSFIGIFLRGSDGSRAGGLYGWVWGSTCYVRYLFVAESLRKQGQGTRLMRAVEAEARARNCRQIVLENPQLSGTRLLPQARLRRDRPRRRLSTGSRISDAGQTSGLRICVSRPSSCVIACGDEPTAAYWRLRRADDDVAGIGVAGRDLVRRISRLTITLMSGPSTLHHSILSARAPPVSDTEFSGIWPIFPSSQPPWGKRITGVPFWVGAFVTEGSRACAFAARLRLRRILPPWVAPRRHGVHPAFPSHLRHRK